MKQISVSVLIRASSGEHGLAVSAVLSGLGLAPVK